MKSAVRGIRERFKSARVGLKDSLAVIDMTLDGQLGQPITLSPYEVFEPLNRLIDRTAHGTKVERFGPDGGRRPFHTLEIHTKGGDVLGYLNMVYLRKPLLCYYLVYVEVLFPFRGRGLGHKILRAFREFVSERGAVGVLDNIILPDEPTYGIYSKHGWKPIDPVAGDNRPGEQGHYMAFVPRSARAPDIQQKLAKLLFRIRKKRPIIDMHENEAMVGRTIAEFRSVYRTLESLFHKELTAGSSTPLMRFMFTRFVTKMLGFRRRIAGLLGYTGGESLYQISISDRIKRLPIQPYSLWTSEGGRTEIWGEAETIRRLPGDLKEKPTRYIEALPLYRRPYLSSWMENRGRCRSGIIKISDLLELGFDPTKLRVLFHEGVEYVSERVSPRFIPSIEKRREFLLGVAMESSGVRIRNARIHVNPPLAILQDMGNVYILRKRVEGIHSEEALDQLRTSPYLRDLNRAAGIDQAVEKTLHQTRRWLVERSDSRYREQIEELIFFVPWDFEKNMPRVTVDVSGVYIDRLWIA
ncbi:MAG: GNAT family N-acetyltransferase [Deltaproteobacteria bacterium]|nr:GNAT family N-acetyltransferase [Deltaproteobacteria bacterium]